jgi:hypothetical protein
MLKNTAPTNDLGLLQEYLVSLNTKKQTGVRLSVLNCLIYWQSSHYGFTCRNWHLATGRG